MPLPRWLAEINKRVFNKREIRRGVRPVLTHVGRRSGTTYQTPLEAYALDSGYIFILMYGSGSDWVQNVMAAGSASLRIGEKEIGLVSPSLLPLDMARQELPETAKLPPGFLGVSECLRMDCRPTSA